VKIESKSIVIDSKSYNVAADPQGNAIWQVQSGERLEKEFGFGAGMGETRCMHEGPCNGTYFAEGFDYTDGTARLHPLITTVGTRYTGTFDDAGGTTLTDAAASFPTSGDGLKGYTVTITAGTNIGEARTITGNTATTLTVASLTTSATSQYDVSVLGSLAYTPLSIFEDFDSDGDRAVYFTFRDMTVTFDIITKKIRPSDDTPIDTEIWGTAIAYAPKLGRPEVFAGATYLPLGDRSGSRVMQKLATVGDISAETPDTWEAADASTWAFACATVTVDGVAKFIRAIDNKVNLTSSEPKTLASYEAAQDVGESTDMITWITELSDGLIAMHTNANLWLWDSDSNAYPVIPGGGRSAKETDAREAHISVTYDDYGGHMGTSLSAGVLHPSHTGFWFYQNGRIQNVAVDQIGQGTLAPYRRVPNISNIPFGNRHYATVVFNQWIYSIYKPTGFSNAANIHIMCGYYQNGEITWRTLLTDSKDIIGLFLDSGMRLWWVSDPQDPATIPGTPSADLKYITLNADGSPRTLLGVNRGTASTTYEYYFPEVDFGLPYIQKQLTLMTLETENLPGSSATSTQLKIHRDGGSADSVGAAITSGTVTERESTTFGTNDKFYRLRPRFTVTTTSGYAPTTSDPRWLRLKVEARSPDTIRTVLLPSSQRNLFETKKILRKLKNAGTKTMREPETNETFSATIIAVNDTVHEGKQAVELICQRFGVAA